MTVFKLRSSIYSPVLPGDGYKNDATYKNNKSSTVKSRICIRVTYFPGRPTYCPAAGKCPVGSESSAASGRRSEMSEWQRSIADEVASATRKISGTATGGHY